MPWQSTFKMRLSSEVSGHPSEPKLMHFFCHCCEAAVAGLFLQNLQHVRAELTVVQNHDHYGRENDESKG